MTHGRTDRRTDGQTDGRYQLHYPPRFAVDKYFWWYSSMTCSIDAKQHLASILDISKLNRNSLQPVQDNLCPQLNQKLHQILPLQLGTFVPPPYVTDVFSSSFRILSQIVASI